MGYRDFVYFTGTSIPRKVLLPHLWLNFPVCCTGKSSIYKCYILDISIWLLGERWSLVTGDHLLTGTQGFVVKSIKQIQIHKLAQMNRIVKLLLVDWTDRHEMQKWKYRWNRTNPAATHWLELVSQTFFIGMINVDKLDIIDILIYVLLDIFFLRLP